MNVRQFLFLISWLLFLLYAMFLAPDGNQGYLNQLITMDEPDAFLLMVFSFLGIYPVAFAALVLGEDDSRVPLWPFVTGAFMLGAFALMPYFFLSKARKTRKVRTPGWMRKGLHSRFLLFLLMAGTISLFCYGMVQGSFSSYIQAYQASQFVHIMTIDFFVLTALSVFVIYWRERRHGRSNGLHWLGCVPIVGILAYLLKRS